MSLSAAVWPRFQMQSFCMQPSPRAPNYHIASYLAIIVALDIAASYISAIGLVGRWPSDIGDRVGP